MLALVTAGACNQFFEIENTTLVSDRPVDPMCPPLGGEAPRFRSEVNEIVSRECSDYALSKSANLAVAACNDRGNGLTIEEGEVDGVLEVAELTASVAGAFVTAPRLAPEGTHLIVKQIESGTGLQHISLYERTGASWTYRSEITQATQFLSIGVPSAAPGRRIMVGTLSEVRELAESGGSWSQVRVRTWQSLGATGVGDVANLSPDGLRLTFTVTYSPMYATRATIDDEFGAAVPLTTVGEGRTPFLTADCGSFYFAGLSSIFRRYQQ